MKRITTWAGNFRNWSTQLATATGAVGALQVASAVAEGDTGLATQLQELLPLWQPFLPPEVGGLLTAVLATATIIARNIPQRG